MFLWDLITGIVDFLMGRSMLKKGEKEAIDTVKMTYRTSEEAQRLNRLAEAVQKQKNEADS